MRMSEHSDTGRRGIFSEVRRGDESGYRKLQGHWAVQQSLLKIPASHWGPLPGALCSDLVGLTYKGHLLGSLSQMCRAPACAPFFLLVDLFLLNQGC